MTSSKLALAAFLIASSPIALASVA
ncbi:MAG: hypothetical protein RLY18_616, partial [Pseudomonadota bacterium]